MISLARLLPWREMREYKSGIRYWCSCGNERSRRAKTCLACYLAASHANGLKHSYNPEYHRNFLRVKKYNLTTSQWDEMFIRRDRKCACCGTSEPGTKKGWNTDHDHTTGKVRGIICHRCNRTLGFLGDSLISVNAACTMFATYLEANNA